MGTLGSFSLPVKSLLFLIIIFFAYNALGAKGAIPLIGQWGSSDGKNSLTIVMDDKNQGLIIKKDGIKYKLFKENKVHVFRNQNSFVQVDLNPSNGNLELTFLRILALSW